MLPHLPTIHAARRLPADVRGSSLVPLPVLGCSKHPSLFSSHMYPSWPDFLPPFPGEWWVLLLGEPFLIGGFNFSTKLTSLDSSRAGLCET